MIIFRHLLSAVLVLGSLCFLPGSARAETYHNCTGVINSLPVTISTQGVWCLRKDLATSMTSGNAITITTNNVIIDCNDFKIGGLAAGDASTTNGIYAYGRQNITVRHCNVRGFHNGIDLSGGGGGHLIEDNRLDNNLYYGINVRGANNQVQRNRVFDTGGRPESSVSFGISGSADLIDNTVAGVFATATNTSPYGIYVSGNGREVHGNQVRGLVVTGSGIAYGIYAFASGARLAGNHVSAAATTAGQGIYGDGAATLCTGNTVVNFTTAYYSCDRSIDNLSVP